MATVVELPSEGQEPFIAINNNDDDVVEVEQKEEEEEFAAVPSDKDDEETKELTGEVQISASDATPVPVSSSLSDFATTSDQEKKPDTDDVLIAQTVKAEEPPKASIPTSSPPPTVVLKGASFAGLYFSTENNGELVMRWSDAPPASGNPLAQFWTMRKVPAFKFNRPQELMRNIGGSKKKFYEGLASFIKEVDANDGHFSVLNDSSDAGFGDVWVSIGGKKWGKEAGVPRKIVKGETVDVNSIEALVILPHACAVFEGILKIDLGRFVNTGLREGAAWQRH